MIKWYPAGSGESASTCLVPCLPGVVQQVTIVFSTLLLPQLSVMVAPRRT